MFSVLASLFELASFNSLVKSVFERPYFSISVSLILFSRVLYFLTNSSFLEVSALASSWIYFLSKLFNISRYPSVELVGNSSIVARNWSSARFTRFACFLSLLCLARLLALSSSIRLNTASLSKSPET